MCLPMPPSWQKARYTGTFKNKRAHALAGVAQWVGHHPTKQEVTGLIPHQGTCPGWGFGPRLRHATYRCFSPSLFPSLPMFLKK